MSPTSPNFSYPPPSTNPPPSQKFQGIKRNLKPTNADTTPKNTPTKATKTTKPKPPTSASASKGRKRKAAEANIHEDDEESTLFTPKSQRSKKENDAGTDGMGAEVFKAEDGENVDLERNEYVLSVYLLNLHR